MNRWAKLYRDLVNAIEYWKADLRDLENIDGEQDTEWGAKVRAAQGCLDGAQALLHEADVARASFLGGSRGETQ